MGWDFTSQVSCPFVLRTPGCRNAEMSQHLFLRVFAFREIRMQGISLLLGIPGCRNAKMSQCLFFRVFMFHEIWVQGISLLLGIPVAEMMKCPSAYSFRFSISRNLGARDISSPWNPRLPKCRNAEMPKCLGIRSMAHNNP
jgi:hypothetical protein